MRNGEPLDYASGLEVTRDHDGQGSVHSLTSLGGHRFQRADGEIIQFARQGDSTTELIVGQGRSIQKFLTVQAATTDPARLAAYVGNYYSAELDARITVVQQGDTLVMRQPFAIEWPLSPSFADGFTARLRGTTTFVFKRTAEGKIVGLSAWATGLRDLAFVKQ